MNPIAQFEASIRDAWRADASGMDRAQKLRNIGSAIDHYVARLDADTQLRQSDIGQAKNHLMRLAQDSRALAARCMV